MMKPAVFINLIIFSNTQLSLSSICVDQKFQDYTTYVQAFTYKNGTNPKTWTHLQAFRQKLIQYSEWRNIALYIKPASSLCSDVTFDIKDEITAAQKCTHTTASVCQLRGR